MSAQALGITASWAPAAFEDFRGRHAGEAVLVCGCGSSATALSQGLGLPTIGVNDIGRLFTPTYLVVVNPPRQFRGDRFRYVRESKAQALFTQLDLGPVAPHVVRFQLGQYGGTDTDFDVLHHTQNSPYVAVCLAAFMGAKRIGLIGVDFTEHHFFGATGRHPLAGKLATIDREYGALAQALAARGVELVNLSPVSRLSSLRKVGLGWLDAADGRATPRTARSGLRIVSYATSPVAGVPEVLARCIDARTEHDARCVWPDGRYGNGVGFEGGIAWRRQPQAALAALEEADLVVAHNGKIDPAHAAVLQGKPVLTMAHNYGWNVDLQHVQRGLPGMVVGQYQATLPEFDGWGVVANPMPLWDDGPLPAKGDVIRIAYTPFGRHDVYPPGHRLFWHAKGWAGTMAVLQRLARLPNVCIETTGPGQVSHAESLAMKRRAHIVIDECVTGSYHRNSLEGLAAGAVVVNGVGLLPGVEQALRACAPESEASPFVFSDLGGLERTLCELVALGADELARRGQANRAWMERHWAFAAQWQRQWWPAVQAALARPALAVPVAPAPAPPSSRQENLVMSNATTEGVSVVIPHGGAERLPLLAATLATLRQRAGVVEIIVVEMGTAPLALPLARRWADRHVFIEHDGAFERARALNAAQALAKGELLLWHDNDLLSPPDFVPRAVRELRERRLDYLIPYTAVRYLSEADSQQVMQGVRDPQACAPVNVLRSKAVSFGAMGLVRRDFLQRHGGLIEGFRGWGGEDNAWNHKVALLGRAGTTQRDDQLLSHLYHPGSGGHGLESAQAASPHYAQNLALLAQVHAVRDPRAFARLFPPVASARTGVTVTDCGADRGAPDLPTVWCYWEGPRPPWIDDCLRSIAAAAPRVRVLTPETFDALWDRDRDIKLSRLQVPHRADYIRAFLLHRYGGLWVDADCLVMRPLAPLLKQLSGCDFLGSRERVGLVCNAFIGAPPGSRIAAAYYERVCRVLRTRRPFGWNAIGADPLTALVKEDARGWVELPCAQVQPICWSEPEKFFEQRDDAQHAAHFDGQAWVYMLSYTLHKSYVAKHPGADMQHPRSFFSYLLRQALHLPEAAPDSPHEAVFRSHAALYRRHGCASASGTGSTLEQTRELRERLPLLLQALQVQSLLDAPCGDLHWMATIPLGLASYLGVDVQREVIEQNRWRHATATRRFLHADLLRAELPRADAILCRDLLPHLSYDDIAAVLRNFRRSGATNLITTTFTGARINTDTTAARWRPLNLTQPPFNFPQPLLTLNEGCSEGGGAYADKSLGVWRLVDLPLAADAAPTAATIPETAAELMA